MSLLSLHGNDIINIFQLLGENENDITYSTGWVLSKSKRLLQTFIRKIINKKIDCENNIIRLQEYKEKDKGYTDIEIFIENELFLIIEAKRGWNLPTKKQLMRYTSRFKDYSSIQKSLVVISECNKKYAMNKLGKYQLNFPYSFISWESIIKLINEVIPKASLYEKKWLNQLRGYLNGVITIQDKKSNLAYCVVLSEDLVEGSSLSYINVVEKKKKYFYPMRPGWPEPPNYMAFRFS